MQQESNAFFWVGNLVTNGRYRVDLIHTFLKLSLASLTYSLFTLMKCRLLRPRSVWGEDLWKSTACWHVKLVTRYFTHSINDWCGGPRLQRQGDVIPRPSWSTKWIPRQPVLRNETLSQKKTKKRKVHRDGSADKAWRTLFNLWDQQGGRR